jgi:ELWxxDGT repeat protein
MPYRHLLRLPLLALLAAAAAAQPASLVRDINTAGLPPSDANVGLLQAVGGKVIFWATQPSTGFEPWTTDGTPAGTQPLGDLCLGECDARVEHLGRLQGLALWTIEPEFGGRLLVRSDGTPEGTFFLGGPDGDLEVPLQFNRPQPATAVAGGRLFFTGCTESAGCEPWVTDGTAAGTRLLADISPGPDGTRINTLAGFRGRAYFHVFSRRADGNYRGALWASDGTAAGTAAVLDLALVEPIMAATANRLFLLSHSYTTDSRFAELWSSDGTAAGTRRLLAGVAVGYYQQWLQAHGDRVYFMAADGVNGQEIWSSDGTASGTRRITDLPRRRAFEEVPDLLLERLGERVVFLALHSAGTLRPWVTTGTPASTRALCTGCAIVELFAPRLLKVGQRVVLPVRTAAHGNELWGSDGTPAGTAPLTEPCPGPCDSLLNFPSALLGSVFFPAREPGGRNAVWRTDGTRAGTRRFARLPPGATLPGVYDHAGFAATPDGRVVFAAIDAHGLEPWASDGTAAGTRRLADVGRQAPASDPRELTPFGFGLAFTACDGTAARVWTTSGTAATTSSRATPDDPLGCQGSPGNPPPPSGLATTAGRLFFVRFDAQGRRQLWVLDGLYRAPRKLTNGPGVGPELAVFGGWLWFAQRGTDGRWSLWRTEGTRATTAKVTTLPGHITPIPPSNLTAAGAELMFVLSEENARQVWSSDGTAAGTRRRTSFPAGFGAADDPAFMEALGSIFFLASAPGTGGNELWRLDADGAALVRDDGGLDTSHPRGMVEFDGALWFLANTADRRRALWRSDGTPEGTDAVAIFPGDSWYDPRMNELVVSGFDGRLYFPGDDGVSGLELWASDGTLAGTVQVRDIAPGPRRSSPANLVVMGPRLYFTAGETEHGFELWQSDGTAAGTGMVQDVAPGALSSHPRRLTPTAGRLYFTADDGTTGRELWTLPPPSADYASP